MSSIEFFAGLFSAALVPSGKAKERSAVVPLLDVFPVIAFAAIIVLLPLMSDGPPSL